MPFMLPQTKSVLGTQTENGNVNISTTVNDNGGSSGGGGTSTPTFQPIILSPKPGVTNTPKTTIEGTCSPNLLVRIFRNNIFAGETYCSEGGRFSVRIALFSGRNGIKAIVYSQEDKPGPASDTINVIYQIITSGANRQPPSTMLIETDYYLRQVSTGDEVYWTLTISGGSSPYEILIDWGDNNFAREKLDTAGQRIIDHKYSTSGRYNVLITVNDSSGENTILQVAVLVTGRLGLIGDANSLQECKKNATNLLESAGCNLSPVVKSVVIPAYWVGVSVLSLAWLFNKVRYSSHIHDGRPRYGHL